MAFSVNEIRGALAGGGARPNKFRVEIANPVISTADRLIPLTAQSASLPPLQIGTTSVPYQGTVLKLAGDPVFPSWTVNFYNDETFDVKFAFENWLSSIRKTELNVQTIDNYKVSADVIQMSTKGADLVTYKFQGIFPTNVGEISLAWDSNDMIEVFPVTFEFDYWDRIGGPGSVSI